MRGPKSVWKGTTLIAVTGVLVVISLGFALTRPAGPQYAGKPVNYWVDQIWTGKDEQVQAAFRQMGAGAVPVILQSLRHSPSGYERLYTIIWANSAPGIQRRLRTPKPPAYQHTAPIALSMIGPAAVPQLIEACGHGDSKVRLAASSALERLGTEADDAVPSLIKLLDDTDNQVRRSSALALGEMQPRSQSAIPALVRQLREASANTADVRAAAARALGKFGPAAREGVPDLQRLQEKGDAALRVPVAVALWKIAGETNGIPILISELETTQDGYICLEILHDLEEMGLAGKPATAAILRKWKLGQLRAGPLWIDVRRAARAALLRIDPEAAAGFDVPGP